MMWTVTIVLQACAIAALVWLPQPAGLYVQIALFICIVVGAVFRFRRGMKDYRRRKTVLAARYAKPVGRSINR